MKFDKSRVYNALNADELKIGSRVVVASNIADLKERVTRYYEENVTGFVTVITNIGSEYSQFRFIIDIDIGDYTCVNWELAYLISESNALRCADLKIGDILSDGNYDLMILGISRENDNVKVCLPRIGWCDDGNLANFHKK